MHIAYRHTCTLTSACLKTLYYSKRGEIKTNSRKSSHAFISALGLYKRDICLINQVLELHKVLLSMPLFNHEALGSSGSSYSNCCLVFSQQDMKHSALRVSYSKPDCQLHAGHDADPACYL